MPMKKDCDIMKCIFMTAIFLILIPALSFADMIILKRGRPIRVEKAWEQDGHIYFYLHGLKMRVAKRAVHRIVSTDQASPPPPARPNEKETAGIRAPKPANTNKRAIKVEALSTEKPADVKPKKPLNGVHWSGFRDLHWGIGRSKFGKLKEIKSKNRLAEVKEYVRADEKLIMGKASLNSIVYAFWRHKLYTITLWVEGSANYLALRNELFNRFGVGHKGDQNQERYLWSDRYSDRMLKYIAEDHTGLFWMRSKELDSLYRLSQIKIPSSYLDAMEANVLHAD